MKSPGFGATTVAIVAVGIAALLSPGCSTPKERAEQQTPEASTGADSSVSATTPPKGGGIEVCEDGVGRCEAAVDGLALTVTGALRGTTEVKPPPGNPLDDIDRDAGVSVELSDGSHLWLFGDTAARNDDGTIAYFVIGTASWAAPDEPAVTRDVRSNDSRAPVKLATPTDEFPTCPNVDDEPGMWPASAVVQPIGERDRVIIWFENICLDVQGSLTDQGMSVGEWWYDPKAPTGEAPIVATILNQRLFEKRSYGSAAVFDTAGTGSDVVIYRCGHAVVIVAEVDIGPCWVAKVAIDAVGDPAAYREWDGAGFTAAVGEGVPIDLPEGSTWPFPPGGFTVAHDEILGAFVMIYSPWPGQTEAFDLRVAVDPAGPWSAPVTVILPNCLDYLSERPFACYAATPQPALSGPGQLGIGYYDSLRSTFPVRGGYMVATIPVVVEHS